MKNALLAMLAVAVLVGCSTAHKDPPIPVFSPPLPSLPPGFVANNVPNPPGTNTNSSGSVTFPPFAPGTNLCLFNSYTNFDANGDSFFWLTSSNLVVGSNYTYWMHLHQFLNQPGPIDNAHGWFPLLTFTASDITNIFKAIIPPHDFRAWTIQAD